MALHIAAAIPLVKALDTEVPCTPNAWLPKENARAWSAKANEAASIGIGRKLALIDGGDGMHFRIGSRIKGG